MIMPVTIEQEQCNVIAYLGDMTTTSKFFWSMVSKSLNPAHPLPIITTLPKKSDNDRHGDDQNYMPCTFPIEDTRRSTRWPVHINVLFFVKKDARQQTAHTCLL